MAQVDMLLASNASYVAARATLGDAHPSRQVAVVTCMDARIDAGSALGLHLGEAHLIRNAGARVTDDVLRSLALSTHVLGVNTVVIMQHTQCGLQGVSDEELRHRTGAEVQFLAFDDHAPALRTDMDILIATPFLSDVQTIAGFVLDVDTGAIAELARWNRRAPTACVRNSSRYRMGSFLLDVLERLISVSNPNRAASLATITSPAFATNESSSKVTSRQSIVRDASLTGSAPSRCDNDDIEHRLRPSPGGTFRGRAALLS